MEPNNKEHRKRIKNKFLNTHFSGWQDYEILEFALFFAIPRVDTKQTAKKLISKFGSLKELLEADAGEILKLKGVGPHAAVFISFLKYFSMKYAEFEIKNTEKISSPEDVEKFLRTIIGTSKDEIFYAIFLNASNKVISCQKISEGVVNRSAVYPRKIVETALKYNATSVIISHNHPGGTCKPSQNDITATEAVVKALKSVDIILLDHMIITSGSYYSFKDNGLL